MAHTYTKLMVHLVFSTKGRHLWITDRIMDDLHAYLGGIVRKLDGTAVAIGGIADHVHLLISYPPRLAIADLVRTIKANSSGWVHEKWPDQPFQWQAGYSAFSVSESNREQVMRYIQQQEEHHRQVTFQDELLQLLVRHQIEYDEAYLWE
ncbi:IS200/IS605 family transposase [bacterium]|nr:IS200/IS605 family transposase [bacterium]